MDGPGYQSRDDGSTTAHPHIRSVDWVWTDTEKWSVTEIGLENQFKQDTVYDYNYFEEFRYKFADSIEGGVGIFEPLETKSRDHTDGSPTHFDTVSKGGESPTAPSILSTDTLPGTDIDREALLDGL